jgi:V8-like Glu-specific endopeptidase
MTKWLLTFWQLSLLCVVGTQIVGCGAKFHSVKPSDNNEEIVYKINGSARLSGEPLSYFPLEMPALPPDYKHIDITQFLETSPRRVVEPALDVAPIKPLADGVVDLADQNKSPYDRIGRLEMRFPSYLPGAYSTCTAQLIGNSGVALTAAHCVFDQNVREWANSVAFRLRYNQGTQAQRLDWECMAMVSGWPNGHYPYDFALIKLRGTPPGGLGMTIGVGAAHVDAVGYPRAYYDTERLVHVTGNKNASNPSAMPGNRMGKGSSGGAWVMQTPQGLTDAVSVNSFYYTHVRPATVPRYFKDLRVCIS